MEIPDLKVSTAMEGNSLPVHSTQTHPSEKLGRTLLRHRDHPYQHPIARHTREATAQLWPLLKELDKDLILDSGCGTGESTRYLAKTNPQHFVIGIDKSLHRLEKHEQGSLEHTNYILVRANIIDFILLCKEQEISFSEHYMFYPNPWPKPEHLKRRWHAHPIFPELVMRTNLLVLRTNWKVYASEYALALQMLGRTEVAVNQYTPPFAISPFERKYMTSRHEIYQVSSLLHR